MRSFKFILAFSILFLFICTNALALGTTPPATSQISICSFNIKFVGHYKDKQNEALAAILKNFDIVLIQELVAPPIDGIYPDNNPYSADKEAKAFVEAMSTHGFEFLISNEDTGTNDQIHSKTSSTEWFILFYKPDAITEGTDIKSQFIAGNRANHDDYERVPYAFSLKTIDGKMDFVLISVHLDSGNDSESRERRKTELNAIAEWVDANDDGVEKDFIILGDMNIYTASELQNIIPDGFISLNDECRKTTTSSKNEYCYDHVMYRPAHTSEIDTVYDLKTINLIEAMEQFWNSENGEYPGEPYDRHKFPVYYSDHYPVTFKLTVPLSDDDG